MEAEDILKQQLHEQKLALNREIALREDLTSENVKLINDLHDAHKRFEAFKATQEDNVRILKHKIIELTNENESRNERELEYQAKLRALEESLRRATEESASVTPANDYDELLKENIALKDELLGIREGHDQLSEEFVSLKASHEQKMNELIKMYEETRESLDIKKRELIESQDAIKELQEEKALLTAEVDVLKAGDVDLVARGNSLFKEVEDKRKKMASAYQTLKNKYLAVQNIIAKKNQEISSLKAQLISLKKYDLNVEEQTRKINSKYLESCEKRIQELEKINRVLEKRKESPEIVTVGDNVSQLTWINVMIDEARAETRKTIAEFHSTSSNSFMAASSLRRAEMENRDLKVDAMKKSARIDELEKRVAELEAETKENVASRSNIPEDSVLTSKSTNKTVRFADAELEETCLGT